MASYVWVMSFERVVEFWNWHQILKLASNFEMFIYFFCFLLDQKKKMYCSAIFLLKSHSLFYFLKMLQNTFLSTLKKTQLQKYFNIRHQFQCPVQMTLSTHWHDPRINAKIHVFFDDFYLLPSYLSIIKNFGLQ